MNSRTRNTSALAALALGMAVAATPVFAQDTVTNAQRAQQKEQKQEAKQEARREKQEREQLDNMPQGAKKLLRTETQGATNIDYYKIPGHNGERNQFGAKFTKADGHQYDLRVDRDGTVISRTDLTGQAQAAAAPATPAPVTPAPAPAPAPAPTSPTAQAPATPAPTSPNATIENKTARRLQPTEIPQNIRTVLDREAQGGTDVKYYRTAYGSKSSFTVEYDKGGEEHRVFVDDSGNVLTRKTGNDNPGEATTASSSQKANDNDKPGRVELKAMPRQAQTQIQRVTEGSSDIKYYRTKYGSQEAFQANYTSKDGKEHRVIVDENGKILSQKDEGSSSSKK